MEHCFYREIKYLQPWGVTIRQANHAPSFTKEPLDSATSAELMTRHGKNQTASAVYTYHEKKKDSGASV